MIMNRGDIIGYSMAETVRDLIALKGRHIPAQGVALCDDDDEVNVTRVSRNKALKGRHALTSGEPL
jgi:hypothetical protein